MAIKIFHDANAHAKVLNVFLQQNDMQKAVQYCKLSNFSPD